MLIIICAVISVTSIGLGLQSRDPIVKGISMIGAVIMMWLCVEVCYVGMEASSAERLFQQKEVLETIVQTVRWIGRIGLFVGIVLSILAMVFELNSRASKKDEVDD